MKVSQVIKAQKINSFALQRHLQLSHLFINKINNIIHKQNDFTINE